jgi:hypothetical protein
MDALTAAGVDANRAYTDKLSGASARAERPRPCRAAGLRTRG